MTLAAGCLPMMSARRDVAGGGGVAGGPSIALRGCSTRPAVSAGMDTRTRLTHHPPGYHWYSTVSDKLSDRRIIDPEHPSRHGPTLANPWRMPVTDCVSLGKRC